MVIKIDYDGRLDGNDLVPIDHFVMWCTYHDKIADRFDKYRNSCCGMNDGTYGNHCICENKETYPIVDI